MMMAEHPQAPEPPLTARAPRRAGRFVVARADEIPDGGRLIVDVSGHSIGVFNVGGRFYALLNRCPHRGAELCRGTVVGLVESDRPGDWRYDSETRLIQCPWHGWEFDVSTGQSYFDPQTTRVRPYEIAVESGDQVTHEVHDGEAAPVGGDRELALTPLDKLPSGLRKGPYTAQTFSVSVEGEYLVLSLRPRRRTAARPASS
jgi:nitrite reductase/ring-hydroxylating ferredoxin subunit